MTPDELDELEKFENENSDMDSPLAPAKISDDIADDHPLTDTDQDDEELYQAGLKGDSGVEEPALNNDVVNYVNPDKDSDK